MTLALALSPSGRLYLDDEATEGAALPPRQAERIRAAFARGAGQGLLQLGAVELGGPDAALLPPSLAFGREIGHLFMQRLTATPDLAEQGVGLDLPPPQAELQRLADAAPPMTGAEYLSTERLAAWWGELLAAAREGIAAADGDLAAWLHGLHPSWNLVGKVCFHLAENKLDEQWPFAFMATYASHVSREARVQHLPLGRALQAFAGARGRAALLGLLLPVQKAAESCAWVQALVDSGAVFAPQAWTPEQAHELLRDIPALEAAGLVVRIPDWWRPQQPPRPQVQVSLGRSASGLGLETMLDFQIELSLDGQPLSAKDRAALAAAGSGLVRLKGRWVEVDRAQLDAVLAHWQRVQRSAADGLSYFEAMRLLAGARLDGKADASMDGWSQVQPGAWLQQALQRLRQPSAAHGGPPPDPQPGLQAQLRPYQRQGVHWLWQISRLGLGGCLADDMGLGKTLQVLALMGLLRREGDPGPHLLVVPASLIANWQAEATRFVPQLRLLVAHPSAMPGKALVALQPQALQGVDVVITSYATLARLPWARQQRWSLVVLDEAQAIKNPGAKQTRLVKSLHARVRLALTGTPVENRLGDLWSLFDFICPDLLGSATSFSRYARQLADNPKTGYAPLRALVQPYILRRLKSDKSVIADLPDKTELKAHCVLSRTQAGLYQQAVDALAETLNRLDGMQRRGAVLAFLMRFKQICNHPSQWLGDGAWQAADSGKFARLAELAEAIAARQEKLLVFTQFQEMTAPLATFLQDIFRRPGLVLHGGTPVKARRALVDAFQADAGPPFFVLSIKAGGSGLNLTAASHVVHFDRWWNPAVENQATDRAYRIGQKKNVLVHKFVCRGTVEEKIDALIESKAALADQVIEGGAEALLTEMGTEELLRLVALDLDRALDEVRA